MSNDEREMAPEKAEHVNRRTFLEVAVGAAVAGAIPEIAAAQNSKSDRAGGPLYMQTNEIQNAIIHYRRDGGGALTEVERVPRAAPAPGLLSRSVAKRAHRTPLRAQVASSSLQIGSCCSRPMAATTRSQASASGKMASSRASTSSRQVIPSMKRAAPPNP